MVSLPSLSIELSLLQVGLITDGDGEFYLFVKVILDLFIET
jgi:hypothetical protein